LDVVLGQVVYSKAGRDKDRIFIVYKIIDSNYVAIVDGKLRKIDKQKVKKIKHLRLTSDIISSIKEKLENNVMVNDAEIRKALAEYKSREII